MRLKIIRLSVIAIFLIIVSSLFYLQAIRGQYYYRLSTQNRIRVVPQDGWRGQILDRNGEVLAKNRIAYNLLIAPQDVHKKSKERLFSFLGETLGVDEKTLFEQFHKKSVAPFAPVLLREDIPKEHAIIIEENKFRFPSLYIEESYKRSYPLGTSTAHILGYVGKVSRWESERLKEYGYDQQSLIGKSGIEEYYDTFLKGIDGGYQIEINSRGHQVRLLGLKEPAKGQDIHLTVDAKIQKISTELMEDQAGSIIVMDTDNGEVLGLVSAPSYDPNVFVDARKAKGARLLFSDTSAPLLNRAIKGLYPPGSVFKTAVAICGLEDKKITPYSTFDCPGSYNIGGARFRCTHTHGPQNLVESIAHSCNVYYYRLGRKVGSEAIRRYAQKLGLGKNTHIDLPYEAKGFIPSRRERFLKNRKKWYTGDTINLSIGQGDTLVTPLQLVQMMSIVANEGRQVQPHLIQSIGDVAVKDYQFIGKSNIDQDTFKAVKRGLRATVTDYSGTAHAINMSELYVAGKTGTAQAPGDKDHHAWFVGYAKGQKKNITFCVFLEHGGSSQNAVRLARELLTRLNTEQSI